MNSSPNSYSLGVSDNLSTSYNYLEISGIVVENLIVGLQSTSENVTHKFCFTKGWNAGFFPLKTIMDVKLFVNTESWQLNGKKD